MLTAASGTPPLRSKWIPGPRPQSSRPGAAGDRRSGTAAPARRATTLAAAPPVLRMPSAGAAARGRRRRRAWPSAERASVRSGRGAPWRRSGSLRRRRAPSARRRTQRARPRRRHGCQTPIPARRCQTWPPSGGPSAGAPRARCMRCRRCSPAWRWAALLIGSIGHVRRFRAQDAGASICCPLRRADVWHPLAVRSLLTAFGRPRASGSAASAALALLSMRAPPAAECAGNAPPELS
jgi:hypothetical protein